MSRINVTQLFHEKQYLVWSIDEYGFIHVTHITLNE